MPESWEEHCVKEERWLKTRPVCCVCGEPIQDEDMYEFYPGEFYCETCKDDYLKECRKNVNDWVEEQRGW